MGENVWYFAYGSNMDTERMKERVGRLPDRIPGVLRNWRLEFNKAWENIPGAGFANIVPCPGDAVEGVLYLLLGEELRELDRYEGVPRHYKQRQVSVERRETGEVVAAVTYVASPDKVRHGLKPTREYIGYLLSGADCLSKEYVQHLQAVETLN
ncbi:gamma-glutamylcyclotransferase family protein [Candidatus Desulforudis audaxviator]|uniref:gamma-glutamylcyclotransferase family protein n=1 Tax=Candidatus Desulforudis audaxviator TaxID=471827 RepID=UPI0005A2D81A|nr:gamma-glutamylcyclotransferase family protein [Candidatus Desulforudis audaxviator]